MINRHCFNPRRFPSGAPGSLGRCILRFGIVNTVSTCCDLEAPLDAGDVVQLSCRTLKASNLSCAARLRGLAAEGLSSVRRWPLSTLHNLHLNREAQGTAHRGHANHLGWDVSLM